MHKSGESGNGTGLGGCGGFIGGSSGVRINAGPRILQPTRDRYPRHLVQLIDAT